VPELPPVPVPTAAPGNIPAFDRSSELQSELRQQQSETVDLKNQIAELKAQLERQQADSQRLTVQLQEQQRAVDTITAQMEALTLQRNRPNESIDQPARLQNLVMGAVGVTLLIVIVGGGMILVGVIVLLVVQSQRRSRPVQVIHPIQPTYTFSNQEFLPPQSVRPRRTRQIDYYED
jgi:hypothetical protein